MAVVFFDLGDTLASPVFSSAGKLTDLVVFPEARAALAHLANAGVRMGLISNAGDEKPEAVNALLAHAGLLQFFDRAIVIYRPKDSAAVFTAAAQEAGIAPSECVFVGENSRERAFALDAGFRVAPHPKLAQAAIDRIGIFFARIRLMTAQQKAKWSELGPKLPIVPVRVTGGAQAGLVVIASATAVDALSAAGIDAETLGGVDAPLRTDLFLVRDDRPFGPGFASAAAHSTSFLVTEGKSSFVIGDAAEGLYLAIPADRSIEEIHFPGARHGHNERLVPDLALFNFGDSDPALVSSFPSLAPAETALTDDQKIALNELTGDLLRQFHEPYAGAAPLDAEGSVTSRHIRHADNGRAVDALAQHFNSIGLTVGRHRFQHEDLQLHNVVAEIAGTDPESFVLVSAHLDSTAAFDDTPYDPAHDPAPGSDDDASGVAAVLAVASILAKLAAAKKPKRSIRFVLFNAEEHGLVGSKAYARSQSAVQAKIQAVFQMDMIGYYEDDGPVPRNFEIHAGVPASPAVESRSLELAQLIQSVTPIVAPGLSAPQIYPDAETGGEDPAAGRSDHGAFNERGYAACVLSQDFFAGPKHDSPEAAPNPNYHKRTDDTINYDYAADIARVVAAAVLIMANS